MLVAFQCCLKILLLRTFTCVTWITRHLWQPALAHLSVPPALGFAQVGVFSSGWVCLSRGALGRCNFLFSGLEGMRNDLAISPPQPKARVYGLSGQMGTTGGTRDSLAPWASVTLSRKEGCWVRVLAPERDQLRWETAEREREKGVSHLPEIVLTPVIPFLA